MTLIPWIGGSLEAQCNKLLETNQESQKYGLILTEDAAKEIVQVRNETLRYCGRVELAINPVLRLIENFCTSSFINQDEYQSTINELQEMFYYLKNETEDEIRDNELIDMMREYFDEFEGSLDLLWEKMDTYSRNSRSINQWMHYFKGGKK